MATTHIDYKEGKGFWIAEIYIELTYEYILQTLEQMNDEITFKEELKDDIHFNINAYAKGMLTLTWHSFLKTLEDEQIMISILESTKILLQSKGNYISVDELNSYEVKKEEMAIKWLKPIKTSEITKIVDTLILMFKGEWNETSYNMDIDYSFL